MSSHGSGGRLLGLLVAATAMACGGDPWFFPLEHRTDCGDGDAVSSGAMDCPSARAWRRWAEEKAAVQLDGCTIEWVDLADFARSGAPAVGGVTSLDPTCRIAVLSEAPNLLAHEALHVRLGANHCGWRAPPILELHADAGVVGGYEDGCDPPPVLCTGNARGWSCRPE